MENVSLFKLDDVAIPLDLQEAIKTWANLVSSVLKDDSYALNTLSNKKARISAKKGLRDEKERVYQTQTEDVLQDVTPLLEQFQDTFDFLSRQVIDTENLYMRLYNILCKAPDFSTLWSNITKFTERSTSVCYSLEKSIKESESKMLLLRNENLKAERENLRLNQALEDLSKELSLVSNQSTNIRHLEVQLQEQTVQFQADIEAAVAQRDTAWQKMTAELKEKQEITVNELQKKIAEEEKSRNIAETAVERLKAALFQAGINYEKEQEAKNSAIELLQQEIEQLTAREALLNANVTDSGLDGRVIQASEQLLEAYLKQTEQLQLQVLEERKKLEESEKRFHDMESEAKAVSEQQAAKFVEQIEGLKKKLQNRPSFEEVEELKEKVRVIEIVNHCDVQKATTDLSYQSLLRQQHLEGLCATYRGKIEELQSNNTQLEDRLKKVSEQLEDSTKLVNDLEGQLQSQTAATLYKHYTDSDMNGLTKSSVPITAFSTHDGVNQEKAPRNGVSSNNTTSIGAAENGNATPPNMLDILISQRDRLRQRLLELEQSRDEWKLCAENERLQVEKLQSDNVALVEKLRYIESWTVKSGKASQSHLELRSKTSSAAGVETRSRSGYSTSAATQNTVWSPYEEAYEAELSDQLIEIDVFNDANANSTTVPRPIYYANINDKFRRRRSGWCNAVKRIFQDIVAAISMTARGGISHDPSALDERRAGSLSKFRLNEKLRKIHALNVPERVVVIWGSLLLSSRATRLFVFFYFLILHVVFFVFFIR